MAKVTVTIELDNDAYDKEYGPGSEFWGKYGTKQVVGADGQYLLVPKLPSEYKRVEGQILHDSIIDILTEGFYDWQSEDREWLKLTIDGKAVRQCCHTVEGDKHKPWCLEIAGPETTA